MKNYQKKFKEDFMSCLPFEERLEGLKEKLNITSEAKRIYLRPHPFKRVTFTILLMLVCIVSTFFITKIILDEKGDIISINEQLIKDANKVFKQEYGKNKVEPFITTHIDDLLIVNLYCINMSNGTEEKIYYYQVYCCINMEFEQFTISFQVNDNEQLISLTDRAQLERLYYHDDSAEESEVLEIYVYVDENLVWIITTLLL